jgi:hypothetical protein
MTLGVVPPKYRGRRCVRTSKTVAAQRDFSGGASHCDEAVDLFAPDRSPFREPIDAAANRVALMNHGSEWADSPGDDGAALRDRGRMIRDIPAEDLSRAGAPVAALRLRFSHCTAVAIV